VVQGNAQGINPYGYVGGNPETQTDPTGNHPACNDSGGGCGGGSSAGEASSSSKGEASSAPIPPISVDPAKLAAALAVYVALQSSVVKIPHAQKSSSPSMPTHQKASHLSPDITSCGAPVTQATCGSYIVNHAVYTSTGFTLSIPGTWCFICSGGGDSGGSGGDSGRSEIMTSTEDGAGVANENPVNENEPPLISGDLYERTFQTAKGPVSLLAEIEAEGDTLHLKDVAIYNQEGKPFSGLLRDMLAARSQIIEEAKSMGFQNLRISGIRVSGSTSANPGKGIDITIPLR